MTTDYWLSKLCFDLQNPALASAYRAGRGEILSKYPLKPDVQAALEADDVAYLSKRLNPYLLRFYFFNSGMPDAVFMQRLREMAQMSDMNAPRIMAAAVAAACHG